MMIQVAWERPYCSFCGKTVDKWKTQDENSHRIYRCPYCDEWNASYPLFLGVPVLLDADVAKEGIGVREGQPP
jgi:transposase